MADDDRLRLADRADEADHVADQMQQRVLVNVRGRLALTVAAHVRGDSAIACFRERPELAAPGVPGLGKAVTKHYQRPGAAFCDVNLDVVGFDHSVRDVRHASAPGRLQPYLADFQQVGAIVG